MRHPSSIMAAFQLVQTCIHNEKYEDAVLFARTAYDMVLYNTDGIIPAEHREDFLADGSKWLAQALCNLLGAGGIPPRKKRQTGVEAIAVARKALEIHTRLHGAESKEAAADMRILARALGDFNDVDDDEILRLQQQAKVITSRLEGSSSGNVVVIENNMGCDYEQRAIRAEDSNDLDRCIANLELALPHFREAARIYSGVNHVDKADKARIAVMRTEGEIRRIGAARAAAATAKAAAAASLSAATVTAAKK